MSEKKESYTNVIDLLEALKCVSCKTVTVNVYCSNKDECNHYVCFTCLKSFNKIFFCPACGTKHITAKDMVKSETLGRIITISQKLEKLLKLPKCDPAVFDEARERKRESMLKDDEIETPSKYTANKRFTASRENLQKKQKEDEMKPGPQTVKAMIHREFETFSDEEEVTATKAKLSSKNPVLNEVEKTRIYRKNKDESSPFGDRKSQTPQRKIGNRKRQSAEMPVNDTDISFTPLTKKNANKSIEKSVNDSDLSITPLIKRNLCKKLQKKNKKGETLLHVACILGNCDKVSELLENGADPNTTDNAGWTPLHEVVMKGNYKLAELLLINGAMVDVPGMDNETPLHEVVRSGFRDLIQLFCKYGANFHAKNTRGETPFTLADPETRRLFSAQEEILPTAEALTNASFIYIDDDMDDMHVIGFDLSRKQTSRLNELAKHHKNLTIDAKLSPKTTHILVVTDDDGKCKLSLNVLQGIVQSRWILSTKWLDECTELELANIREFEVKGINGYDQNGPERSRMNRFQKKPKLFDQCHIYFKGINAPYELTSSLTVNKQVLSSLIVDAGGEVLRREPCPESVCNEIRHPYHAQSGGKLQKCAYYIIYSTYTEPCYNMEHIKALPLGWLLDCICLYQLKEP